jgi:Flp pilus assembly protein TadG
MVEMVFVLPVLLLLMFAVAELSVLLGRQHALSTAAREGVRELVLYRDSCDPGVVQSEVQSRVRAFAATIGLTLTDAQIVIDPLPCQDRNTPTSVTVRSTYTFQVLANLAPSLDSSIDLMGHAELFSEGIGGS